MTPLSSFLVVWSLLLVPADGVSPMPASSHYYWSESICSAAAARFVDQVRQQRLSSDQATGEPAGPRLRCVPYMLENPDSAWVFAHVIGPCEPAYADCAGLRPAEVSGALASQDEWYSVVRERRRANESLPNPPTPSAAALRAPYGPPWPRSND